MNKATNKGEVFTVQKRVDEEAIMRIVGRNSPRRNKLPTGGAAIYYCVNRQQPDSSRRGTLGYCRAGMRCAEIREDGVVELIVRVHVVTYGSDRSKGGSTCDCRQRDIDHIVADAASVRPTEAIATDEAEAVEPGLPRKRDRASGGVHTDDIRDHDGDQIGAVLRRERGLTVGTAEEDDVDEESQFAVLSVGGKGGISTRPGAVVAILVAKWDEHFIEQGIGKAVHLDPWTAVHIRTHSTADGDALAADRRIDSNPGVIASKGIFVAAGLQTCDGDLQCISKNVETLETIDSVSILAKAIVSIAVVVHDAGIQEIENAGSVRVESIFARTGPCHYTAGDR